MAEGIVGEYEAKYLSTATQCMMRKKYKRALDAYLSLLTINSNIRKRYEDDVTLAFNMHLQQLKRRGQFQEIFSCFEKVHNCLPDSCSVLNIMGAQLFR